MDRYKKKNMKFMGKGPEVRASEMNAARRSVRQQRFSLQRPLEEPDVCQPSKVPTLGIPKPQSRLDMLHKWKAEKQLKKSLEMVSKKPVFKVGASRPQEATDLSRIQDSKTSFSSKVLTPNRSKALQASRILPVSRLADIHNKGISSSKPEAKASVKTNQTKSIPSAKPQIARFQINKPKNDPTTKPQIAKPQPTKVINAPPSTKSTIMHSQPRQNLAKNSSAPSNLKPQSSTGTGMKNNKNLSAAPNFKPQSNGSVKESKVSNSTKPLAGKSAFTKEENKISTSGIKPSTLLPQRKPQLQNRLNKPKPVPTSQSKRTVNKAVEIPLNQDPEVKNPTISSSEHSSLFPSCQLSVIEAPEVPLKEKSFAPPDFVFCPPKIRSSWLDEERPETILTRVMKEMNLKQRTSTPIKEELMKYQELESSFNTANSMNTGESSSDAKKEYSTIPNSDTKYIESLIDSSSAKLPEPENDKAALTDDSAEDSKSVAAVVSSDVKNQGLESDVSSVNKEMGDLFSSDINLPVKDKVIEPALSDVENLELEASPERKAVLSVASEKNSVDLCDDLHRLGPLKELTDNLPPIVKPCLETINQSKDSTQEVMNDTENSVFYPSESAAVAPEKSKRRFFSNCWKMGKPSLALISESPENSKDVKTPKSHRRKGLLQEEFTPRRSMRLARRSELKEEINIFEVKECFLDSPSVEAATRMSMVAYDFDRLHLEASGSQGMASATQSTIASRGKVSLLYTPPRLRASTRNKSLKGDLMTFSPNVE